MRGYSDLHHVKGEILTFMVSWFSTKVPKQFNEEADSLFIWEKWISHRQKSEATP